MFCQDTISLYFSVSGGSVIVIICGGACNSESWYSLTHLDRSMLNLLCIYSLAWVEFNNEVKTAIIPFGRNFFVKIQLSVNEFNLSSWYEDLSALIEIPHFNCICCTQEFDTISRVDFYNMANCISRQRSDEVLTIFQVHRKNRYILVYIPDRVQLWHGHFFYH